ncbi:hypothetical protein AQUCO_00300111v1 [Aquilegia coerulea]|uniref:Uncharacterized protein n=1 Tax=Aquilegia coerulea TaxID=218851 RepID=A0A2G5EXE6_AQUCA|nr:hypothetical protein AQUCO_00300111v1 [Aquilegia coerulea]
MNHHFGKWENMFLPFGKPDGVGKYTKWVENLTSTSLANDWAFALCCHLITRLNLVNLLGVGIKPWTDP